MNQQNQVEKSPPELLKNDLTEKIYEIMELKK